MEFLIIHVIYIETLIFFNGIANEFVVKDKKLNIQLRKDFYKMLANLA